MKQIMKEIRIPVGAVSITGNLTIPVGAQSIVIFSHGSGSSRFSPWNNYVAGVLNKEKTATLLIDLLTPKEDEIYENRFNIDLLTERLIAVTGFIHHHPELKDFSIGYFGASTGAASALQAAAETPELIDAVVSRGGRPDLAENLSLVKSPTLLIIGSHDELVIELNEQAYRKLHCKKEMVLVEDATHLFEEPGTLEEVAKLAAGWFKKHLLKVVSA
jgi:putative phosphoribosyl transferase